MTEEEKKILKIQAQELKDILTYNGYIPPEFSIVLKKMPDAVLSLLAELEKINGSK